MSCGSVDDFECGNGDCINYSLTCDGMAHCKDKSDEKQSYCGEFVHQWDSVIKRNDVDMI